MEIPIIHNNIDWIFIIDDYDYILEQKEAGPRYSSGGEPGFPESIEINKYSLELAPGIMSTNLTNMINKQLDESNNLCEYLFNLHETIIHDEVLEIHLGE